MAIMELNLKMAPNPEVFDKFIKPVQEFWLERVPWKKARPVWTSTQIPETGYEVSQSS